MAPPLALGEVPEEVRMNKLLGMNAPPAAKVYNEKERYHVECCVEINQCVGCTRQFFTKSFLGDDARPRHRAGVASMAWRTTR